MATDARPNTLFRNLNAKLAALPMILCTMLIFVGCSLWTIIYSFTSSKALPVEKFVGFAQYERLFNTSRWVQSVENIMIYGIVALIFSFVVGFILAAFLDQKIRFENTFRTIFLYPFALSFIVTGVVWQWILDPSLGLQETMRNLGWVSAGIVKLYDLVVALTNGGPGLSSEVPAKYVYDFMFSRANIGQGLAASTVMLATVFIILIPWIYLEYGNKGKK